MENEIATKTSEELGLILQEQHRQIRICETNIQTILQELSARRQKHIELDKETTDGK